MLVIHFVYKKKVGKKKKKENRKRRREWEGNIERLIRIKCDCADNLEKVEYERMSESEKGNSISNFAPL
jgi:hypothetical protein